MTRSWLLVAVILVLSACRPPGTEAPAADAPPADCPATVEEHPGAPPAVPQQPTADTAGRLVPSDPPTAALLCHYGPVPFGASPAPVQLSGQRELTGLARLPDDLFLPRKLGGQGRACTAIGGPSTPYLLRLTYPDGVVWVSTVQGANGCDDATNGDFLTAEYLGRRLASSYDAGSWALPPRPSTAQPCDAGPAGRAGQEGALVPGEPRELRVCTGKTDRVMSADVLAQVREVLSEPVAEPSQGGCAKVRSGSDYLLQLSYDRGPVVGVQFSVGCEPDVDNGSLQAQLTPAQEKRLQDLVALR